MCDKSIRMRFLGERHSIDINTLINCMIHYNAMLTQIHTRHGEAGRKIEVNVDAMEKGSFELCISLHEGIIESLFSERGMDYLASMTSVASFAIMLYKLLKGRPVKSDKQRAQAHEAIDEAVRNINVNLNVNINVDATKVIDAYNDKVVRMSISKQFDTLSADENVEGVEINNGPGLTNTFDREEFEEMRYDDFASEGADNEEIIEEVEATLNIVSLNFERDKRWTFIYNGFRIPMPMKNPDLRARIDAGERFGKGDAIRVRMRIVKKFNSEYNTYENKAYNIVEFIEHIVAPAQPSLF